MAQATKKDQPKSAQAAKGVSLRDFQKKVDAGRAKVDPYQLDLEDGGPLVVIKDPTELGVGTMQKMNAAGQNLVAAGFAAFEALFSPEDFQRVLRADPPMRVFEAILEDVSEHYGVPSTGESVASLD